MEEQLRIFKPYIRGFPLIVLAMILAVVAAKKYLSYVTPLYESTVKLRLADVSEGVPSSNLFKDFDVFASANKIAAEIEVIKSSAMINHVLDSLDFDLEVYRVGSVRTVELYHESPFVIDAEITNSSVYDKAFLLSVHDGEKFTLTLPDGRQMERVDFGQTVTLPWGNMTVSLNRKRIADKPHFSLVDQYTFQFLSREKLVQKIEKQLDVVAVDKDVPVLRMSLKNPIAEKASRFVNKMAESYISDYIDTKYRAANTTVRFLNDRIANIAQKLASAEDFIQHYRDDHKITNIHQETETDLRKVSQLKVQHASLRMNLDAIADLHDYIENGKENFLELAPNFEAFTDLLSTEIIKKIKQLQADKKDLLITYTPQDERVKVIDTKIADLTSYLEESIGNTHRNVQVKYDRLTAEIAEAEKAFIGIPEKERMLMILNREFEIYQRSYNFLNEKKIEAEIAQAARIAFHRVITPGTVATTPVSPNRAVTIIVSALMAMFGSIGLIFVVHAIKAKVNDIAAIERNSTIPVALATPFMPIQSDITRHFLKEAIQLELKNILHPGDIVVLTSPSSGEGRTFHAWHLCQALAAQKRKVLLVEVYSPSGNEVSEEHTVTLVSENLGRLALSTTCFAVFTKRDLEQFVGAFKTEFDLIVINNEPMKHETIGLMLMSIAQTNLLVVDARKTPRRQITELSLLASDFSLPNPWFVLNKASYNPNVIRDIVRYILRWRTQRNGEKK